SVSLKSLPGAQTQVNLGEASSGNQNRSQLFHRDIQQASFGDGKKETTEGNQAIDQPGSSSNKNKQVVGPGIRGPNRSWVNLFAGTRAVENGMMLTYITPDIVNDKVVVKLDKEEVKRETIKWKSAPIV
ncbi:hypothetical protein A4A49_65006, partial [Nicotiana attenuata]